MHNIRSVRMLSHSLERCGAAELGSSRALESDVAYVGRVGQILPRQSARQEERIREAHARLDPTLSAQEAEARFLACAATFDTYALDPFAVKVCAHPPNVQNNSTVCCDAVHCTSAA